MGVRTEIKQMNRESKIQSLEKGWVERIHEVKRHNYHILMYSSSNCSNCSVENNSMLVLLLPDSAHPPPPLNHVIIINFICILSLYSLSHLPVFSSKLLRVQEHCQGWNRGHKHFC